MEMNIPMNLVPMREASPSTPNLFAPKVGEEVSVDAVLDRGVRGRSSQYRGVSFDTKAQKWRAQISVDGKTLKLGTFSSPEAAAFRYDEMARELKRPTNLAVDYVPPPPDETNQTQRRKRESSGRTSKYKGVSWYPSSQKWVAQIRIDGKKKGLGLHETEEAAALKYDEVSD
jgi:hypothetical protein